MNNRRIGSTADPPWFFATIFAITQQGILSSVIMNKTACGGLKDYNPPDPQAFLFTFLES